jgi:hypothetical protein
MFDDPDDLDKYLQRQTVVNIRTCPIEPSETKRPFRNKRSSRSPMVMRAKNLFTLGLDQATRDKIAARTNFSSRTPKADAFQAVSNLFEKLETKRLDQA